MDKLLETYNLLKLTQKEFVLTFTNCQKREEKEILPNSFNETSSTLILKPDNDTIKKNRKLQANIHCEQEQNTLSKILANQI
jgi:hypothetical protein